MPEWCFLVLPAKKHAGLQVVGAAAMLGGVTRMTISITVLAMEGTAALQLIVPLMLAVFVAKMVGDALTPSIYDVHIKIRGAPVLVSQRSPLPLNDEVPQKAASQVALALVSP